MNVPLLQRDRPGHAETQARMEADPVEREAMIDAQGGVRATLRLP